jgi:hypothetical protein
MAQNPKEYNEARMAGFRARQGNPDVSEEDAQAERGRGAAAQEKIEKLAQAAADDLTEDL